MAVSYEFRDGVLVMRLEGTYEMNDLFATIDTALADPARPDPAPLLAIMSESESAGTRSNDDVRRAVARMGERAAQIGYRFAAVAPKDLEFGLMRMASMLIGSYRIELRVFRDEETAWAWIRGTSTDPAAPAD